MVSVNTFHFRELPTTPGLVDLPNSIWSAMLRHSLIHHLALRIQLSRERENSQLWMLNAYSVPSWLHSCIARDTFMKPNIYLYFIETIWNWRRACDECGLSELDRSHFNQEFLNFILDELMPWHRERYDSAFWK